MEGLYFVLFIVSGSFNVVKFFGSIALFIV